MDSWQFSARRATKSGGSGARYAYMWPLAKGRCKYKVQQPLQPSSSIKAHARLVDKLLIKAQSAHMVSYNAQDMEAGSPFALKSACESRTIPTRA